MEFYKKIQYPDGDFYIDLIKPTIDFTFRINKPEDLWELTHLVDVLNNNNIKPIITIPNLFSAQADRRFAEYQSSGLKLVCKFLNNMKATFKIFHPHNAEVVEALMDNVEIINSNDFTIRVIEKIRLTENIHTNDIYDNFIILTPDAGAFKWASKLNIPWKQEMLSASKSREFINNKSILTQQLPEYNFKGKDILLLDDICIYGGTFKGLSTMLRQRNCGKLYLAVSHITIQNHEKDNVFEYFDRVFTTNSKYDNYFVRDSEAGGKQPKNLEIIKLF